MEKNETVNYLIDGCDDGVVQTLLCEQRPI
jgi:hypothetical protein